jgi:hypothetical protein
MREQKGVPEKLTISGSEWFRTNNFTVLPIVLVDPLALYGYGDIRSVPAVRLDISETWPFVEVF